MDDIFDSDFDDVFGNERPNIFNGKDFYDDDGNFVARTMDTGIGSIGIYSSHGWEGNMDFNDVGDDIFYGTDGDIVHFDFDTTGNGMQIMQYEDPLAHVIHYVMPDLIL